MKLFTRKSGEGPPLLILHGLLGSSDNWQTHAKKLSGLFTVYLVDLRNHGHSPHDSEMNYDVMSHDIRELIEEHSIKQPGLIGHSMGGKTVARFAQLYPGFANRLVIADIGIKEYPPHHDLIFRGLMHVDVENCPDRKTAELRLEEFVPDIVTRQFLMKGLYWKEPGKLGWRFNVEGLSANRTNLMAGLPEDVVKIPTLFIRGEKSNYVTDQDMTDLKKNFPQAEFETIEGTGHWVHAEAPEKFLSIVTRWLS